MKTLIFCSIICIVASCTKKGKFVAAQDDEISIQAIVQPSGEQEQIYQVRIIPSNKLQLDAGELGKKMQYNIDSCFYVLKDNISYYPQHIIPIANGISTNYEYLLSFSNLPTRDAEGMELVYHDKYMNQKDYKMLLN